MLRPLQRSSLIVVLVAALSACACGSGEPVEPDAVELTSVVVLHGEGATSQDDMCIWVHPDDPEQSTIITGNKDGGNLYVYDLDGNVIQIVETQKPGNVDLRYGFPLGGRSVDIVAHSQRDDGDRLRVWAIDPVTRQLTQVDNGQVYISPGYGATLYHSASTSKYYFFKTTQERGRGGTEQYELLDDGNGKVTARSVRQWDLSGTEGMVADDRTGKLYVASEDRGILEFGAEPEDPIEGRMIARVGENGLHRDVEGLALYKTPGGGGYLIASSQGRSRFVVYKLDEAYSYAGSFTIVGVQDPDGIAVTSSGLGSGFAQGLFASHSWESEELQTVHLTPWATIVSNLE